MRIPMLLDLSYKNFKCEKVWLEEKPLDAQRAAMARRLGIPETESILCWEIDRQNPVDLDKCFRSFADDLFNLGDEFLFKGGSLDDVKDLFLKYGPLFSGDRISIRDLKDMLCGFYLIAFAYLLNQPVGMGYLEEQLLAPWKSILNNLYKIYEISGRKLEELKVFSPMTIYPTRRSWPVFHIPLHGFDSLQTREDIIRYFDGEIIKNVTKLIQNHSILKPIYNKRSDNFELHMAFSDAFTFAVAKVVFGKSEPKKCKCGCGLPALKGDYYDENHKRKMLDTAVKQKVIRYFYKTLDAKHNRERHEAVKEIINKQWNKGVRSEDELKRTVRKALHLT